MEGMGSHFQPHGHGMERGLSFPACWISAARNLVLTHITGLFFRYLPCAGWGTRSRAEPPSASPAPCHCRGSDTGTRATVKPPPDAWIPFTLPQGPRDSQHNRHHPSPSRDARMRECGGCRDGILTGSLPPSIPVLPNGAKKGGERRSVLSLKTQL